MTTLPQVLVVGGAGYIGAHACKALHAAGFEPICLDNLVYGHEWAVRWGPLIRGDIADESLLNRVFSEHRIWAVMHFAAYAYVGESVADPARYYGNNVSATLVLLNAMRRHGVTRFVFSSTCATYGVPTRLPIPEDHPQAPINPYGHSKLMVEQILADFRSAYGLRSVSLRYFNAAGADPDGEIGESHDPETHLIPLVLDVAAGRRDAISVFGRDYDTPDGTCVRDYIHVTDLADAHVLALGALRDGSPRPVYNLGNGRGFSVAEVIDVCRRVTGHPIPVVDSARRPGDPPVLVGDATRARAELGWSPRYAELESIVETAWRWHQIRPDD